MNKVPSCDLLIFIAMEAEAKLLIEQLGLIPFNESALSPLPARSFRGNYRGSSIVLVTQGQSCDGSFDYVGTQFAAATSWAAIQAFSPKQILNAGTAGGFIQKGAKIGDVYINAEGCVYHDRRIDIPSYATFSRQAIPSQTAKMLAHQHRWLKPGLISTGSALDTYTDEIARILASGAHVKEMEAASIAEMAALFNKEIIALKAITDFLDGKQNSAAEFVQNLQLASKQLSEATMKVIDFLTENN